MNSLGYYSLLLRLRTLECAKARQSYGLVGRVENQKDRC